MRRIRVLLMVGTNWTWNELDEKAQPLRIWRNQRAWAPVPVIRVVPATRPASAAAAQSPVTAGGVPTLHRAERSTPALPRPRTGRGSRMMPAQSPSASLGPSPARESAREKEERPAMWWSIQGPSTSGGRGRARPAPGWSATPCPRRRPSERLLRSGCVAPGGVAGRSSARVGTMSGAARSGRSHEELGSRTGYSPGRGQAAHFSGDGSGVQVGRRHVRDGGHRRCRNLGDRCCDLGD